MTPLPDEGDGEASTGQRGRREVLATAAMLALGGGVHQRYARATRSAPASRTPNRQPHDDRRSTGRSGDQDDGRQPQEDTEPDETESLTPHDERFGTVVDVDAAGGDPTGQESVSSVLRAHAADETLLFFPEGRYRMTEQVDLTGFSNVGLYGPNATIVPATYHEYEGPDRCFRLGTYYDPGERLLVEGLTFDFRDTHTGLRAIQAQVADGLEVRDVDVLGVCDTGTWGPALFDVTDPYGEGVVERLRIPDGGRYSVNAPGDIWTGPTGVLVSQYHRGTVTIRDLELGGFPDNGLYASDGPGQVHVRGGKFHNSNVASVRLGGDGSSIVGSRFVVDRNRPHDRNQRAIRLDQDDDLRVEDVDITLERPNGHAIIVQNEVDGATIRDVSIEIHNAPAQGIVVSPAAGATEILDTDIHHHSAGNAINLRSTEGPGEPATCRNVSVDGTADGHRGRHAVRCARPGSVFVDLDIDQPGDAYRRCLGVNAEGCRVTGGRFRASHYPIVVAGSGATVEGVNAASYDGYEAIRILADAAGVRLEGNVLANGVRDLGADGLELVNNTLV